MDLRLKLDVEQAKALRDVLALSFNREPDATLAPVWDEVVDFLYNLECLQSA